jgi:hypothetical protein
MTDVFISYKKEDLPRIEPIARALANAGYEVWWDHRIPAGRSYRDVIVAALQTAKCVIVVWSNLSANAQWVLDEADEGKKRGVLLPLVIDDVEIPYGFRQIEAARLVGWSGDTTDPEWQNALSAVAHFVGRPPGAEPPKPFVAPHAPKVEAPAAKPKSKRAPVIGGIVAALVVAAGLFAAYRHDVFGDRYANRAPTEAIDVGVATDGTDMGETAIADAAPPPSVEPASPVVEIVSPPVRSVSEAAPTTEPVGGSIRVTPPPAHRQPQQRVADPVVLDGPIVRVTPPPGNVVVAPRRCIAGYVWRETRPGDTVCVSPESRDRVRRENAQAASRVDPYGAYGPQTCKSGYVWRNAYEGDLVCVAPEIRGLVASENQLAASRMAP